jgi:hypothetical protein
MPALVLQGVRKLKLLLLQKSFKLTVFFSLQIRQMSDTHRRIQGYVLILEYFGKCALSIRIFCHFFVTDFSQFEVSAREPEKKLLTHPAHFLVFPVAFFSR